MAAAENPWKIRNFLDANAASMLDGRGRKIMENPAYLDASGEKPWKIQHV